MRGKGYIAADGFIGPGITPPMRGKAAMAARIPGQYRITPAYAGKSA